MLRDRMCIFNDELQYRLPHKKIRNIRNVGLITRKIYALTMFGGVFGTCFT